MRIRILSALLGAACLCSTFQQHHAIEANQEPYHEIQPDGSTIVLKLNGDEFSNFLTDINDFPVVMNEEGFYVYADVHEGGVVDPTAFKVSPGVNPADAGLHQVYNITKSEVDCTGMICDITDGQRWSTQQLRSDSSVGLPIPLEPADDVAVDGGGFDIASQNEVSPEHVPNVASLSSGHTVLKNLVVLVRWNDHQRRKLPSRKDISTLMNKEGGDRIICPTGSVRDVFLQNSYGQMKIESTVLDWITLSKTEKHYARGESGLSYKFHEAIHEALAIVDNFVDFRQYDVDGDGMIDSITFIHSGYAAEFGGTDAFGARKDDRIWSHKWAIWSDGKYYTRQGWKSREGVSVYNYNINSALWHRTGTNIARIGVIAHELGHFLGVTDLYDGSGGRGIGRYGLMASGSWGFDRSQLNPLHASAWSKLKWGWLSEVTPRTSGLNYISATEDQNPRHPQVYKIGDGRHGFPRGEYLLIENRQKRGLDVTLPQGGLVIWKIDDSLGDDYDTEGFPGQPGWPRNGKHYRIAMLQADGAYDLERGNNRGDVGDVFHARGVSRIAPSSNFERGPFPNTDSYQNGNMKRTNNYIFDISGSADVMSFRWCIGVNCDVTKAPTSNPTSMPTSNPTLRPTSNPTSIPTSNPTRRPTSDPTSQPTVLPTSNPTSLPTSRETQPPTPRPTSNPTTSPTKYIFPSSEPTFEPTEFVCRDVGSPCSSRADCCSGFCRIFVIKGRLPSVCIPPPTRPPTPLPSSEPSPSPSSSPSQLPTAMPSADPTSAPTSRPTSSPTSSPTSQPTSSPTSNPTSMPTDDPTATPTFSPTELPTGTTPAPSVIPSFMPSFDPSSVPSTMPSSYPSFLPTQEPGTDDSEIIKDVCLQEDQPCVDNTDCCSGHCRRFVVKSNHPNVCKPKVEDQFGDETCGRVRSRCTTDKDCCGRLACWQPRFRKRAARCFDASL